MPKYLFSTFLIFILISCSQPKQTDLTVKNVMDEVITRLYEKVSPEDFETVNTKFMLDFMTEKEKEVLATKFQYFKVNVPVKVSLMRNAKQVNPPYWLEESGFIKTDKIVKNENYQYEVWQKDFDAGWVNLGIPGFDKDRVLYFITVGARNETDKLKITEQYPSEFSLEKMEKGAFTYHDWSDLKITELPTELEGQVLFTTVRGRAREAHVEDGFRKTIFPSSNKPDQIMLTWTGDPSTTVNMQWRTNTDIKEGNVQFWAKGTSDTLLTKAKVSIMEDRMLYNDRYIHRFTSKISQLEPNTTYEYRVGSAATHNWSDIRNFKTEAKNTNEFSLIWFGDTHKDPKWAELLNQSYLKHPEVSFYSIAGDLVTTGLYRSEWDEFFGYTKNEFAYKPLMPVLGNHDRQDGLGAWMYYELFSLPENGPEKVDKESTYSFEYGNALYLMIDATQPNEAQTAWIENQLKNSKATWKFVMFHFPPYNFEEPYLDIQKEWGGLFDTYHVDMVLSGHIHYYMRSKPINAGKVVDSYKKGTVYAVSIGTNGNHEDIGEEPYAVTRFKEGQFYQHMAIKDKVLKYTTYNKEGKIVDEFMINKNE